MASVRIVSFFAFGLMTLVASGVSSHPQQTERWTLADVVSDALAEHPIIVASRERIAAAEGSLTDAGRWQNPRLYVTGENLRFGAEGFDPWTQADWFVFVTQTIDTAGKRGHRARVAQSGVELATLEQQIIERELVHRVKVAFQNVLTAQQKLALARDSSGRLEDLVELNHIRATEGYAPEGDYIKSLLEAQRFAQEVRLSELALHQSKIQLLQSLGRTNFAVDFELESSESVLSASLDEDSLRESADRRPELRAAEAVVALADASAQLEGALAHPDVAASVGYKRNGPANTLYMGMSVPLPLLDRNQGGIVRGRAELAAAQAELLLQRSRVLGELEAALERVRMMRQQVESLQTDFVERADESRAVALAAYTEGAADLLTVLEAERTRNGAQELVVDAVHDYVLALYELERAAGVRTLPRSTSVRGEAQ